MTVVSVGGLLNSVAVPAADARVLLSAVTGIPPLELLANPGRELSSAEAAEFAEYAARAAAGEPVQYIVGSVQFRDIELTVTPAVLIPRPETELLAGMVVDLAPPGAVVGDICAGSGAIALAVAAERPDVTVVASDISVEAIGVAKINLKRLGLDNVVIIQSDLFGSVDGDFDVIVSNPPYVSSAEFADLPDNVRFHEPGVALLAGADGLDVIRRLVAGASGHLRPGGWLMLEIGESQGAAVGVIAAAAGFAAVEIISDLAGRQRFIRARWPGVSGWSEKLP